jgi:hypothetical protein
MTNESSRGTGSPHKTDRRTAAAVGVLFIIGTVSGVLMVPVLGNTLNAPDHLITISMNESRMILATLLKFIMGVACAGIGLALYPLLRKYNEGRRLARLVSGSLRELSILLAPSAT